jgi:glutamine amidotransferase-like uncharacterized protein
MLECSSRESLVAMPVAGLGAVGGAAHAGNVLIFTGKPMCSGCGEAWGPIVKAAGATPVYTKDFNAIPDMLNDPSKNVVALLVGGTDDDLTPFKSILTSSNIAAIQKWLREGGRYLGSCGGADITPAKITDDGLNINGLNISPMTWDNFISSSEAQLVPVNWYGQKRDMYYQAGPQFHYTSDRTYMKNYKVVATYVKTGTTAAFTNTYGKGKVHITGVHPEADVSWLCDEGISTSGWKDTSKDLAVAFMKDLLSGSSLNDSSA